MSAKTDTIVRGLMESIKNVGTQKTSAYDSIATVRRIEDGIAWVHFEGGAQETPARLTINAKVGEQVQVRVSDGVAFLVGNASAPPTDDTRAKVAEVAANNAVLSANIAFRAAGQAVESAAVAAEAAEAANDAAGIAFTNAEAAQTAATNANQSANSALTQLSVVEDIVGVLTWISEHGEYAATADTEVVTGKMYFIRAVDEDENVTYTLVAEAASNPSEAGYYELSDVDEAVTNYINAHLALTDTGLWVVKDDNGYKSLLANDGMKVYDPEGALVATFGESVLFSAQRPQRIGGDDAFVEWYDSNGDGEADSLRIVGANIVIEPGDSIDSAIQNAKDDVDVSIAALSENTANSFSDVNDRYDSLKAEVDSNDEKAANEIDSAQSELQAAIDAVMARLTEAQSLLDAVTTKTDRFGFSSENGFILYGQNATDTIGFKLQLAAQVINFINGSLGNSADVLAYIAGNIMNIENAVIRKQLRFGNFAFIPRANGNMSLKYLE